MVKLVKKVALIASTVVIVCAWPGRATQAFVIFDALNLTQNSMKAAETVKDYIVNYFIRDFEARASDIQDTESRSAWEKVDAAISTILESKVKFDQITLDPSILDRYLDKFQALTSQEYEKCNSSPDCDDDRRRKLENTISEIRTSRSMLMQTSILDAQLSNSQMKTSAEQLRRLQRGARSAQGRLAAAQYASEYAAEHCQQIMQLRSTLAQITQVTAAEIQAEIEEERRQTELAKSIRRSKVQDSTPQRW